VEVLQKGYRMPGRVLRPATVVVSTGGPERKAPKPKG
jgi:molecular chaperone GrpE (heat shock protein)